MKKQKTELPLIKLLVDVVLVSVKPLTTLLDYTSIHYWKALHKDLAIMYKQHHERKAEVDHVSKTNQLTSNYTYVTHTGLIEWTDGEYTTPVDGVIPMTNQYYEGDILMMQQEFLYFYGYEETDTTDE